MSHLNKLRVLRKEYPNNQEFAEKVDEYLKSTSTCCSDEANLFTARRLNTHPYGWDVTETICKECGKIVDVKVDN